MNDFFIEVLSGFIAMSYWEYIAVAFSVSYLLLAIKQSLWCWPFAFLSTLVYTLLFYNGALLMESILHIYYMAMAVYGWYSWKNSKKTDINLDTPPLEISSLTAPVHGILIVSTAIISTGIGYVMDNYTHADFAYLDSFTSCFAVVATYLVAKKILENWLYWIIIDAASIYLYVEKGYLPTAALFIFYTMMAAWGFKTWYLEYENKNKFNCIQDYS